MELRTKSDVFNVDCLEFMRGVPDNAFDLGLADPPYGIGADKPTKKPLMCRQKNGTLLPVAAPEYTHKDWDAGIPGQEFFDELARVCRHRIIFGANYFGLRGGMIVWDKMNGGSDQFGCEIAYQSFNQRTDVVHYMWSGMIQGTVASADFNKAMFQKGNKKLNEKRIHPCQKPVALYHWLLENFAAKYGCRSVFDPMMGSQSSRIACYKDGIEFTGCEMDPEYFEKGCERFREECLQQGMLDFAYELFDLK